MQFHVFDSPTNVALNALERILKVVSSSKRPTIALPTGKTPMPLYEQMAKLDKETKESLAKVNWFALDEFLCQDINHESTFRYFLESRFLAAANLSSSVLNSLSAITTTPEKEATSYEAKIAASGGLDLAVLGIGLNGHIGFNEPGTPLDSRTGVRQLTEKSRKANAYLFGDDLDKTPTSAITMGIGTIMDAKKIVLLATGASKVPAIKALLSATTATPDFPASVLLDHPNVHILCDKAARTTL